MKRGIWHVDADNDVNEGIRIASMVLNQRMVRFCRQTVPRTIQEMQTYAWDAKAAQRGEEKPLKNHDHGPDAFRYFAKTEVPYWRLARRRLPSLFLTSSSCSPVRQASGRDAEHEARRAGQNHADTHQRPDHPQ
jgi:hypothetical protein